MHINAKIPLTLENKMDKIIENLEGDLIKSITGYEFYLNAFYSVFKD